MQTGGIGGASITSVSLDSNLVVSGTNRGIYACVFKNSAATSITSVVFNGTETLSPIVSVGNLLQVWYRPNPTATTADVVATMSSTENSTTLLLTAIAVSDASQANPTLTNTNTCSSCTTIQADLTTTVDNSLLITCSSHNIGTATHTHGAGQQERSDFGDTTLGGPQDATSTSSEVKATAGLETLSTTASTTASTMNYLVIAVEPFVAPSTTRRSRIIQFR